MSGQAKKKRVESARNRSAKRERVMTDRESAELLESASQALAMVRGSKLIGGRISVRQAPVAPRPRDKSDILKLRGEA